jgi:hypothetical protein
MNIVVKSAVASAVLAYACANPVEIIDDVQVVNPSVFGDAGPGGGAAGEMGQGGASRGGTGAGNGGSAPGTGGAGGANLAGMPVGLAGAGGLPVAGAGGSGAGGAGTGSAGAGAGGAVTGGVGGAAGASGGSAGAAAGAAGTTATAGTGAGATSAVFDPASCDFGDTTGCDELGCQEGCPTNDGGDCARRCTSVIGCVSGQIENNPDAPCVTEADPLCGARLAPNGNEKACTSVVEPAGGFDPPPPTGNGNPQPSFVAREFVECICSVPRP